MSEVLQEFRKVDAPVEFKLFPQPVSCHLYAVDRHVHQWCDVFRRQSHLEICADFFVADAEGRVLLAETVEIFRYAWFIPRGNGEEQCHNSLITGGRPPFSLTELGEVFVNLSTQDKNLYYTPGQIIQAEHYSACQGGITVEPTTDEAGLLHIGNLVAGQKVEYQVDVPGGSRQMELRVRTYLATSVDFTVNGSKVTVNLPDTGRSWSTITVELPFADGKQTIAIEGTNDISPMFNWFRIL